MISENFTEEKGKKNKSDCEVILKLTFTCTINCNKRKNNNILEGYKCGIRTIKQDTQM
jgi:hypothetical protein